MLYSVMDAVQCNPVGTIPSVTDRQTFPARVRSRLLIVLCRRMLASCVQYPDCDHVGRGGSNLFQNRKSGQNIKYQTFAEVMRRCLRTGLNLLTHWTRLLFVLSTIYAFFIRKSNIV